MMNLHDYLLESVTGGKTGGGSRHGRAGEASGLTEGRSYHDKKVWDDENDFSDWLKDNMGPLDAALRECPGEMDIVAPEREWKLPCGYKVDIYAGLEGTDEKVVIENQFGESDHRHLGQILAYSIETDARHIIWNVEKAGDTHAEIVRLLNEDGFNGKCFYLVEMTLKGEGKEDRSAEFKLKEGPCLKEWSRRSLEIIDRIC